VASAIQSTTIALVKGTAQYCVSWAHFAITAKEPFNQVRTFVFVTTLQKSYYPSTMFNQRVEYEGSHSQLKLYDSHFYFVTVVLYSH